MNTLQYRLATVQDAPQLGQMNKHLIEDEGYNNPMTVSELTTRMRRWLDFGDYSATLFSSPSGEAIGYAMYRDEGGYVYIRHFFVQRAHRRSGNGRVMVRLLRERILPRKRITLEVLLHNERAISFYRATGFQDYALIMEIPNPASSAQ